MITPLATSKSNSDSPSFFPDSFYVFPLHPFLKEAGELAFRYDPDHQVETARYHAVSDFLVGVNMLFSGPVKNGHFRIHLKDVPDGTRLNPLLTKYKDDPVSEFAIRVLNALFPEKKGATVFAEVVLGSGDNPVWHQIYVGFEEPKDA